MSPGFVQVVRSAELGGPPFTRVEVEGTTVLLVRLEDGRAVAFGAACPHQGQPMSRGLLTDGVIECPFHYYGYDPTTGRNVFPGDATDAPLPVHEVDERDGWVWVRLASLDGAGA